MKSSLESHGNLKEDSLGKFPNIFILDLSYTRGEYDVVATVEAPSLDTMTALKLSMMKTGAIAELTILEDINLNAIAKQGADMIGLYKAPGK